MQLQIVNDELRQQWEEMCDSCSDNNTRRRRRAGTADSALHLCVQLLEGMREEEVDAAAKGAADSLQTMAEQDGENQKHNNIISQWRPCMILTPSRSSLL